MKLFIPCSLAAIRKAQQNYRVGSTIQKDDVKNPEKDRRSEQWKSILDERIKGDLQTREVDQTKFPQKAIRVPVSRVNYSEAAKSKWRSPLPTSPKRRLKGD